MPVYVIGYAQQDPKGFLAQRLGMQDLCTLRLGSETYAKFLQNKLALCALSQWKFLSCPMPSDLGSILDTFFTAFPKAQPTLEQDDGHVVFINMRYFPLALEELEKRVQKALTSDIPLCVYAQEASPHKENTVKILVCLCVPLKYVFSRGAHKDSISKQFSEAAIVCSSKDFVDLNQAQEVLRLFASGFSLRYFNSLKYGSPGYFVKYSLKKEKMCAEHKFLSTIPESLRPFYPRVGKLTDEGYEIEIIYQLDVAKSLLNGVFDSSQKAEQLVHALFTYLDSCPKRKVTVNEYKEKAREVFLQKGKKRLAQTLALAEIVHLDHICNLQGFASFKDFSLQLLAALENDIAATQIEELVFAHGDLFFSNILFDADTGFTKLIDPRGTSETSLKDCYLPAYYDLAKLSHSFCGLYDLIVYGLSDLVVDNRMQLEVKCQHFKGSVNLEKAFKQALEKRSIVLSRIRLYEASLFCSMIPLHADNILRMATQCVQSINTFKKSIQ